MVSPKSETIIDHRSRVRRVMTYIDENLDQICPLERLAQEACLSPFHFNRVFAACTGETVKHYWIRARMVYAALSLVHTNRRVIDIAMDIGYESHNAFSKAFRTWHGISPRAYRDNPLQDYNWGYSFNRYSAYRKTYLSYRPVVWRIAPCQMIYKEMCGSLNGASVETAISIIREIETALRQLGLMRNFCGWISAFPARPAGFSDPNAPLQVGALISRRIEHIAPLKTRILGGGRWAVFHHVGPLEYLLQTWNAAYHNWIPSSGLRPRSDTPFEWYKDLFTSTPIESNQTYLHIPIQ